MKPAYNFLVNLSGIVLRSASFFSKKLHAFMEGRKDLFPRLQEKMETGQKYIWIHAASLGEFEMAVPVLELLKEIYPDKKILVSFFSPSGYENKRSHPLVDVFTYLPLDTHSNAEKFLDVVDPDLCFFIKYDFWPNFLYELKNRGIRTILVSGIFREDQVFFKSYGNWMKESLSAFDHFFVQNERSATILQENGFQNVTIAGDTRFDRVSRQLQMNNKLDFVEYFKDDRPLVVCGSTWPEDDEMILNAVNSQKNAKFIIAPHEIKPGKISELQQKIERSVILYSEMENQELSKFEVLILNTIGKLGRAYSYADIAFVGGASGNTGLHNILEPATFGIPIIIGPNHQKFPEAQKLMNAGGLFSVKISEEFSTILGKLIQNEDFRKNSGAHSKSFIQQNTGAIDKLKAYLLK